MLYREDLQGEVLRRSIMQLGCCYDAVVRLRSRIIGKSPFHPTRVPQSSSIPRLDERVYVNMYL